MQVKELNWSDNVSDGVLVSCHSIVKIYDSIKIEFQINHSKEDNMYYLYSFGKGSIRRLETDKFTTVEDAKTAAYEIYSSEMIRIKQKIDMFFKEEK